MARRGDVHARVEREVAVTEHEHAVGEQDGLVDVVRHEQHCGPVAVAQPPQQRVHPDPRQGVERTEGFVEQEQLRLAHHRAGERDTLRLAARKRLRPVALVSREADLVERGAPRGRVLSCAAQSEHHVVEHARPWQEPRVLEHDGAPRRYLHLPFDAGIEAREGAQQGGLARTAAAEQRDELAGAQLEVDTVEDGAIAVPPVEVATPCDDGRGGRNRERVLRVPGALRERGQGVDRHASAFRSMARTSASESRPRSAYTASPTRMTSVWKNSCARTIK